MLNHGDKVKLLIKQETVEGILMPSPDDSKIILKLANGYNVGYEKKDVKLEILEKSKSITKKAYHLPVKKNLPTIAILHTGGTIASRVDYETGGVKASFTSEDFLEMFPEINEIANVRTNHIANMMSEDMRFSHYRLIAKAIVDEIKAGVKGIIVGHGTDTIAITSAALSFMFENLPIPVILVGSQRSSDRGSTDAAMNLICAAEFIAKTDFTGVAVCLHGTSDDKVCHILPATKTRKLHTSRRDAFKAVNSGPLAEINYETKKIIFLQNYQKREDVKGELKLKDNLEDKVAVVRVYPNMGPVIIDALTEKKYQGIILEATGIGQAPTNIEENLPNYKALQRFIEQGGVIVLTSQCIFGRVHPDIYTNCRRLREIGIIFGEDMLTETAHIKLAWLLANYPKTRVEELAAVNLRGEINEALSFKEDFLK
ncbi:MAG TPA: Glu-tRNA(Gln) amidotransferase subunit GatD [Candidatus Nanoarchaeia archaeon]|nr:Glu-tRNA(Gln) amidotransferase subunit GatD [Candidatus Nanoarchaeia archaeon]